MSSIKRRVIRAKKREIAKLPVTFITSTGVELDLVPVPPLLLMAHYTEQGKPQPPMKVVPGGFAGVEAEDFEDKDFKEKLALWNNEHSSKIFRLCVTFGVETEAPVNDPMLNRLRFINPNISGDQLRYEWIAANLPGDEEMGEFIEAVMGQTVVTEEGLAQSDAEERFREVGQRDSGDGVGVREGTKSRRKPLDTSDANGSVEVYGADLAGISSASG